MMNDAVSKTVSMLVAAARAMGNKPGNFQKRGLDWGHVHVDCPRSGSHLGVIVVYASGRWSEQRMSESGAALVRVSPEIEALRFRRAA